MVLGDGRCIAPLSRSTCWERPWPYIRRLAHVCTFMFWVIESVYGMYESFLKKNHFPIASNLLEKQQSVLMAWDETACSGHLVSVLRCPPFEPPFPLCSLDRWWLCICTVFSKYFTVCLKWNLTFPPRLLFTLQLSSLKSIYWPKPKGSRAQTICHLPTSCVASKDCALTFL